MKRKRKMYVAIMKHDSGADPTVAARESYDEVVDVVHKFFLDHDFEIRDGKPYDSGNDDGTPKSGFKVFDNVKMHKGKVAEFMHCDGDGPVADIVESI